MRDDHSVQADTKQTLDKRLEALAWALFLIMIGCLWLMPERFAPNYAWLFGAGGIMLGLNATRFIRGIITSGLTIILGILAIVAASSKAFDLDFKWVPILLIVAGVSIIYSYLVKPRRG